MTARTGRDLSGVLLLSLVATGIVAAPASAQQRPNVVIIMTDDQRWDSVTPAYTPDVVQYLKASGITFKNAFVSDPLCCPSRSSTLTGDYAHTTGVYGNAGPYGGFETFTANGDDRNTIATDFDRAGYRTALIGKYLNGYRRRQFGYIPPGWDRWFAVPTGAYYDYYASDQGRTEYYGHTSRDYVTRVLRKRAVDFIDSSIARAEPFFLYLASTAPHPPATPDPRDVGRFSIDVSARGIPSYDVVEDTKPQYIRARAAVSTSKLSELASNQLSSAFGVDRAIGTIWNALPDDTIVLFTSDNGYLWGEHRWSGKQVPYNESIRVPMILAFKGSTPPYRRDRRLVLNVDIRPTLERLAGVSVSGTVEGMDMLGSAVRDRFVLEHQNPKTAVPTYCGFRSATRMYVRYATGEEELYAEDLDPYETANLAGEGGSGLKAARDTARDLCTGGAYYPPDWPF